MSRRVLVVVSLAVALVVAGGLSTANRIESHR